MSEQEPSRFWGAGTHLSRLIGWADFITRLTPTGNYQLDLSNGDGTFTGGSTYSGTLAILSGDFDGDGCADTLQSGTSRSIAYSCNPAVSTLSLSAWSGATLVLGDFNGDGKTDILVVYPAAAGTLYLSTGTGLVATAFTVPSDWGKYTIVVGDWNGDGKQDIALMANGGSGMYTHGTNHQIWMSTGTGFVSETTISNSSTSDTTETTVVADWNNDGAQDLWQKRPSGDAIYTFAYTPELMTSVSNGIGATTTITYDRLNKNSPFYTKSTASFPQVAIDGPLYVVSQLGVSNGIGGTYTQTYAYTGGFGNAAAYFYSRPAGGAATYSFSNITSGASGPALFGFSQIAVTDSQTGLVTTTSYRTDYPYAGQLSGQTVATTVTRSGCVAGTTVRSVADSYDVTPALTSPAPYFVHLTESIVGGADCDGTVLPQTKTDYTYDAYGNPTAIDRTVSLSGTTSSTSDTTNTFSNDTVNWLFLLTQTVTENVKGTSDITRTTNFGYQTATNVLNDVRIEPGDATLSRETAFTTIDAFGNPTAQTVSGANIATRSSSVVYDTQGRFVTSATDTLSHTTHLTWNADFGTMASRQDVNSHTTAWSYDTFGRPTRETRPDGNYTVYAYFQRPEQFVSALSRHLQHSPNGEKFECAAIGRSSRFHKAIFRPQR